MDENNNQLNDFLNRMNNGEKDEKQQFVFDSTEGEKRFYQKGWFIGFLFVTAIIIGMKHTILFVPISLIAVVLMLKNKNFHVALRAVLTVFFCFAILGSFVPESHNDNTKVNQEKDSKEKVTVQQKQSQVSPYKIVSLENEKGMNRVVARVVMENPLTITADDIKAVTHKVTKDVKQKTDFTALIIYFYDDVRQAEHSYTVAMTEYSPYGEHSRWAEAKSNYSNFKYVYNIGSATSNLLPKDNLNYPSKQELDYYFYSQDISYSSDPDVEITWDELSKMTGEHFGVKWQDMEKILLKCETR